MPRVFLHIGMPRTATTYFQNKLFPLLTGLDYHQLPETHFDPLFQRLLYQDESLYNPTAVSKGLRTKLFGEVTLFSNENFIGQSLFMAHGNRSRTALRLKSAFPDAEVILFLRGQVDLLKSLYAIDVAADLSSHPDEFVFENKGGYDSTGSDWRDYAIYNTLEPREHLEGYRYKELLDLYHAQFKRVHVFLFEDFRKSPRSTVERLVHTLGQPWTDSLNALTTEKERVNASVGGSSANRLRRLNKWIPLVKGLCGGEALFYRRRRRILAKHDTTPVVFSREKQERLEQYFSEANKELLAAYPELGVDRYSSHYSLNR